MPVDKIVDQRALGAAIRYAAVDKDVVIVAAAGICAPWTTTANRIRCRIR